MNSKKRNITYLIAVALPLIVLLFHYFYLRTSIINIYQGDPDAFLNFLIDNFYPRFAVEKQRFDLTFFLKKANQVVFRFIFVYYILLLLIYLYKENISFWLKIQKFLYAKTSVKNIAVLRIIFFAYFLYLGFEMIDELILKQSLKFFYKPVPLLSIAHIPFPNIPVILTFGAFWYLINFLLILNIRVVLCSVLSFFIFLLFQSWLFSFEKIDHGYATITYVFLLIPFLFDEQRKNTTYFNSWSLQLIRISIATVYLLSGMEKILMSGFSWLKPENLKTYLSFHETALSKIVVQSDFLCVLLSIGSIAIQLSFILIIFLPRWKWVWIVGGILFHTGTLVLMKIGILFNPWILVYIFFFDWTNVYDFFQKNLKRVFFVPTEQ
jgi:hypothetical protein